MPLAPATNPLDNDANTGGDASDSPDAPTLIVPGAYEGRLTSGLDTVDAYAFDVASGGRVRVHVDGANATLDASAPGRDFVLDPAPAGRHVLAFRDGSAYTFWLAVLPAAAPDDAGSGLDAGDDAARALPLAAGTVAGRLDALDARDTFVVPASFGPFAMGRVHGNVTVELHGRVAVGERPTWLGGDTREDGALLLNVTAWQPPGEPTPPTSYSFELLPVAGSVGHATLPNVVFYGALTPHLAGGVLALARNDVYLFDGSSLNLLHANVSRHPTGLVEDGRGRILVGSHDEPTFRLDPEGPRPAAIQSLAPQFGPDGWFRGQRYASDASYHVVRTASDGWDLAPNGTSTKSATTSFAQDGTRFDAANNVVLRTEANGDRTPVAALSVSAWWSWRTVAQGESIYVQTSDLNGSRLDRIDLGVPMFAGFHPDFDLAPLPDLAITRFEAPAPRLEAGPASAYDVAETSRTVTMEVTNVGADMPVPASACYFVNGPSPVGAGGCMLVPPLRAGETWRGTTTWNTTTRAGDQHLRAFLQGAAPGYPEASLANNVAEITTFVRYPASVAPFW